MPRNTSDAQKSTKIYGVLKWRVEEEEKKKSHKNQNFNLLALKWH
jgi:hypothetical protein